MILYHGTSTKHIESIKSNGFYPNTWFALEVWHAFKLAYRTARRDGGLPVVLEVDMLDCKVKKIEGRKKLKAFQYIDGDYEILNSLKITKEMS